jgi:ABC-type multidrug transport system ATPase subunit
MANFSKIRSMVGLSRQDTDRFETKLKDAIMKDQLIMEKQLFDLQANEILGIYGPTGSGKSTLLRLFDLSLSQQGFTWGTTSRAVPPEGNRKASPARTERIEDYSGSDLSALDVLIEALHPSDLRVRDTRMRLKHALVYLCREGEIYAKPLRYASQAMVAKVMLLRAILDPPAYLLLDEPTEGLSERCRSEVHTLLLELKQKAATTFILTTRDPIEAVQLCDRLVLMDQGRVLAFGAMDGLRHLMDQDPTIGSSLSRLYSQLSEEPPLVA